MKATKNSKRKPRQSRQEARPRCLECNAPVGVFYRLGAAYEATTCPLHALPGRLVFPAPVKP